MGSLGGHVLPGLVFLIIGLWDFFNQIKMYAKKPKSYRSSMWFPTKKLRYLELYFMMFGASASISMELFVGPKKHHPLEPDGSISVKHLHNFEHATISLSILTGAILAWRLDKVTLKYSNGHDHNPMLHFLVSVAFLQEFLLFRLHSTDHVGLEWHYHLLLQCVILVSLFSTLIGAFLSRHFFIHFVRTLSVVFQGVWLNVIGAMLYTPSLMPKGCFIELVDRFLLIKCPVEADLHRAKSLVNLEFCWYLTGVTILAVSFYAYMIAIYGKSFDYSALSKEVEERDECVDHSLGLEDEDSANESTHLKENKFGKFNVAFEVEKR